MTLTVAQEVHVIHVNQTQIIIPDLSTIQSLLASVVSSLSALRGIVQQQGAQIMSTLTDLQAADAAIKTAVQNAIALIQSLHTGAGTVSDAEVEAVVTDLNAAATALGGATPQP